MMYPAPGPAGFVAALITHGVLLESLDNEILLFHAEEDRGEPVYRTTLRMVSTPRDRDRLLLRNLRGWLLSVPKRQSTCEPAVVAPASAGASAAS